MRWTERQRAMLREMGIVLWAPEPVAPETVAVAEASTAVAAVPAMRRAGAAPVADAASLAAVEATAPAAPRLPGLAEADWLVVAEPLDGADPQQEQLLENMLRAIGVGLIAPNRERRAVFFGLAGEGKSSAADGAALEAALRRVAPRCVLALGRVAAAALLGADAPLGGLRGRVHDVAGVPVVVTFSLAFLLRHPMEKAKAWADLCLAVGSVGAPAA